MDEHSHHAPVIPMSDGYAVSCSCGWIGAHHRVEDPAEREARGHEAESVSPARNTGSALGSNASLGVDLRSSSRLSLLVVVMLALMALGAGRANAAPALESRSVSFQPGKAVLRASVNPNGTDTVCWFEWGRDGFEESTPAVDIGSGETAVAVEQAIEVAGLTSYHYRVAIMTTEGILSSQEEAFTTPDWRPEPIAEAATLGPSGDVILHGSVNPEGLASAYQFEWGETTAYGQSAPLVAQEIGSGEAPVAVADSIDPGALGAIHYRVRATNAQGTRYSADQAFDVPPRTVVSLPGLAPAGLRLFGLKAHANGRIDVGLLTSGAGSLRATATVARPGRGGRMRDVGYGSASATTSGPAPAKLTIWPRPAVRQALGGTPLHVRIAVVYSPREGASSTLRRAVSVRLGQRTPPN